MRGTRRRVVVVGGGLAGLRAAIAAALAGADVRLLSKVHPLASTSSSATGGISAAIRPDDAWEDHAADTLRGGAGLADHDAVVRVCAGAAAEVRQLAEWGAPFDRAADGGIGAKGISGNSRSRMVAAGDHTGRAILRTLWRRALAAGVEVRSDALLLDLLGEGAVTGVRGLDLVTGEIFVEPADAAVLATGGLGRVYAPTTNPAIATGDGTAAALRFGASLRDMEMTQFYPTCLPGSGVCVTEEARVKGAWIVDDRGERFLLAVDPQAELANRDVLSRALFAQARAGRRVYLDCRHLGDVLRGPLASFRALMRRLAGIDVAEELLPVTPAHHYQMGGIATDAGGHTGVPGLFAAGECACVSVHGANRIGGNSLLETLVFGGLAGRAAAAVEPVGSEPPAPEAVARGPALPLAGPLARLRSTMTDRVGILRDGPTLEAAAADLHAVDAELAAMPTPAHPAAHRRLVEARNAALLGRVIAVAALARAERRGAHWRTDAPPDLGTPRHTEASLRPGGSIHVDGSAVRGGAA